MRPMTTRVKVSLGLVVLVLVGLGYSQYWILTGRVMPVDRGRLYRSAALPPQQLIALCRRYGITTVVDFRNARAVETRAEAAALTRAGVAHVNLPTGQGPPRGVVEEFLRVMDQRRDEPVLIHCTHGVGRTGVFTALYRMEYQRWSPVRAMIEEMVFSGFGSFAPRSPKGEFLLGYTPRGSEGR
jgi:hypothetical protein